MNKSKINRLKALPDQCIIDMKEASRLVDETRNPMDYQIALVRLAVVARQFLRVLDSADRGEGSPCHD